MRFYLSFEETQLNFIFSWLNNMAFAKYWLSRFISYRGKLQSDGELQSSKHKGSPFSFSDPSSLEGLVSIANARNLRPSSKELIKFRRAVLFRFPNAVSIHPPR